MAHKTPHVKCPGRYARFCDWIDHHPRLGWYIAIWAFLISLESLVGYIDLLLRTIS